jgi:hypothetical protein
MYRPKKGYDAGILSTVPSNYGAIYKVRRAAKLTPHLREHGDGPLCGPEQEFQLLKCIINLLLLTDDAAEWGRDKSRSQHVSLAEKEPFSGLDQRRA